MRGIEDRPTGNLREALCHLSLSWHEAGRFIIITRDVKVAAWGYDELTGENLIGLHPRVLSFPPALLGMIIEHELLHYASYGKRYEFDDHELANLVLDVVINHILYRTNKHTFCRLARKTYAQVPPSSPIVLAAGPDAIALSSWRKLHQEIWQDKNPPNPYILYYKLRKQGQKGGKGKKGKIWIGFGEGTGEEGGFHPRKLGEKNKRPQGLSKAVARAVRGVIQSCGHTNLPFAQEFVRPSRDLVELADAERLLALIRSSGMVSEVTGMILTRELQEEVLLPYVISPTSTTLVYMAAGISPDLFPFFNNLVGRGQRPRLAAYVDTSGSLVPFREIEVRIIGELVRYLPARIYVFADEVKPVALDAFARGEYPQGAGTNFAAVLAHFLELPEEVAVLFTDGYSSAGGRDWGKELKGRGKRFYIIYLVPRGHAPPTPDIDRLARDVAVVRI